MNLADKIKDKVCFRALVEKMTLQVDRNGFLQSIYINSKQRTGSLRIDFAKNVYYDFAVNRGGSVIDFYADYHNTDIGTAIKELAMMFGIEEEVQEVKRDTFVNIQELSFNEWVDKLAYNEMSECERYYYDERLGFTGFDFNKKFVLTEDMKKLFASMHNQAFRLVQLQRILNNSKIFNELYDYCKLRPCINAYNYLVKVRKLPLDVLDKFKVFTIANYFEVNNHLRKMFSIKDLQRSGLFSEKGNLIFASHRIIIPYLNNNDIVYLRGRYFDAECKLDGDLKYLGLKNDKVDVNSPKRFFNFDVIKGMLDFEKLYITEGEFDTIALKTLGFNAIAVPGSGNIPRIELFARIKKFNIVICVDDDEAGKGLLTGEYTDKNGELRKRREWLLDSLEKVGASVSIKELPTKDVNELLMREVS